MGIKISELNEATSAQNSDVLPIVQNEETKKISVETLGSQKVNKSGDTMTGGLLFKNKDEYDAIRKNRILNGTDYQLTVGLGRNGSARMELVGENDTVLGSAEVRSDGIYNGKTNKKLAEQNAWQTATINSNYCSGGICKYISIGEVLLIVISDLVIKANVVHNTTLFSGLPAGKGQIFLVNQLNNTLPKRLRLTDAGNIVDWYDPISPSGSQFYGNTMC